MDSSVQQRAGEDKFLRAHLLGDIREDIRFLGLSVWDLCWIIVSTIGFAFLFMILPINPIMKVFLVILTFVGMFFVRLMKIPYRAKRLRLYRKEATETLGEHIDQTLDTEEDGPFYRSGKEWHMVFQVNVPPWNTAVISQKQKRILVYEQFLRASVLQHVDILISWDQAPDFQWQVWDEKRRKESPHPGIERIKHRRLAYFQRLAEGKHALRTSYDLRLSVNETNLRLQEREAEEGLSKEEVRRRRIMEDLKEIKSKAEQILEEGGHQINLVTGYSVTEMLSRQWDPIAYQEWIANRGTWEEPISEKQEAVGPKVDFETESLLFSRLQQVVYGLNKRIHGYIQTLKRGKTKDSLNPYLRPESLEHPKMKNRSFLLCLEKAFSWIKDGIRWYICTLNGKSPEKKILLPSSPPSSLSAHSFIPTIPVIGTTSLIGKEESENMTFHISVPKQHPKEENGLIIPHGELVGREQKGSRDCSPAPFLILTSPAPTGKSFLASNIAAANAAKESPVTVVDFSVDRGLLTYLNLAMVGEEGRWEKYQSRLLPGLDLYIPKFKEEWEWDTISSDLCTWAETSALVIIELPWQHPWHSRFCSMGTPVAVVDSDYHHWLQWEKAAPGGWKGGIWWNQVDAEINVESLIRDHWGDLSPTRTFPTFAAARKYLFQGRPIALDEPLHFLYEERD